MLSRRGVILAAAGTMLACRQEAQAQQPSKTLRVGFVGIQVRGAAAYRTFQHRMAEHGYREGANFTFDYLQAPSIEGYDAAFRALATRNIDIFLAAGSEPALRAVRAAAGTKPIAFLAIDFDPLAKGYVASLARPGGNITGILVRQIELAAKRIELLREAFPTATRVGLLCDAASREQVDAAAAAARKLGFASTPLEVTGQPPDYASALGAMDGTRGQPVVVPASPLFARDRVALASALLDHRTPAMCALRDNAEAGALMSYGVDLNAVFADIADCVVRIARGRKSPAEIPIEQSTRVQMTVNLKTASALGLALPMAFTARANEVFE
jgi:putative ABC transport system substrate-binding protein